jgi:hypothetical protein
MNKENVTKNGEKKKKGFNPMWIMPICCGLPILGFLVIGALGTSSSFLETLFVWACPIGMVAMMLMHNKQAQKEGSSCCASGKKKQDNPENIGTLQESESK